MRRYWSYWKQIGLVTLIVGLVGGGLVLLWLVTLPIPDFQNFDQRVVSESTKIYDRTGQVLLYDIHENIKRQVVGEGDISKNIKNATVAIEDSEFYQHRGVKLTALLRAFLVDLLSGRARQGGSTITQQLVKNSLLNQDKKITRKLKEIVLALKLERVMTKEQILSLYLNEAPYGGNIYGVEEAAETFFGKSASEVSLGEAAYLAAIPRAPTYYSPYGSHRADLDTRQNVVLKRMSELGFITAAEADAARAETITFVAPTDRGIKAPHFVEFIRGYLEEKFGRNALLTKGFKVTTTLDWPLQQKAEEIVKKFGAENLEKFRAKNAGLVALDPTTGQILVMVGSKDYFDIKNEGNFNVTTARRQPGSAFKPIVYAAAFNQGFTPETVVFDLETQFDANCSAGGNCYKPSNYDDKFRGPIDLRHALAQSINIPAIKVLYLVGLKNAINLAQSMGIESLNDPNRYGLTLVIGGGEVSLLDLSSAYGVFANDGLRQPATGILKIEDSKGQTLETFMNQGQRVLPENTARLISDILSDVPARVPTYAVTSALTFPGRQVAVKTGTTNDYRDAWTIGYTPRLVVGAWVGNNDNTPMEKKVAGQIVTPMWHAFMVQALDTVPVETFPPPEPTKSDLPPVYRGFWQGGQSYFTDKISGKLATEYTPLDLRQEHVLTQVHSILYWLGRTTESQFQLWEEPVRRWAAAQGLVDQTEADIPTATDDIHLPGLGPQFNIISPVVGQIYSANDRITIQLQYRGRFALARLDVFAGQQYLGSLKQAPFNFSFLPSDIDNPSDSNTLRVIVYDSVGNQAEQTTNFKINQP